MTTQISTVSTFSSTTTKTPVFSTSLAFCA
jgi:hypothetical protein